MDTKKKELVGSYKNAGREWHRKGQAPEVNVYDFVDRELGRRNVRSHAQGILAYDRKRMTTALMEGLNSLMQAARSRARGYRNPDTFTTMIYLIAGRLDFGLPSLSQPTSRQLA